MSDITVNVTNAGAANVSVSNGSTVTATVGNGGSVNVAVGTVSPGNATVVAGTLAINSTTTLAPGSSAYVKNVGTAYAASLDIGIPSGNASTVQVGSTTTLDSGNASVTGTTNGSTLTLAFAIPRGTNGINGTNGTNGVTPTFTASASTLSAGSSATVTTTTTNNGANVALAFGIPQGAAGSGGGSNLTLSDATPSALGTAAAGSSTSASRSDHTHALPVIAYGNLSGVPSNFPTNTTLVSGLSAGYSAANHGHNYVTSLNNLTGGLTLAAGSNVTLTANGSTLTIDSSGGSSFDGNATVDGGDYTGQLVYTSTITITSQPTNQTASSGNATFGVSATVSPSGTPAYQWQRSTDAGTTWVNVTSYTSGQLSLSDLTQAANDANRYRAIVSASGAASVTTNSATLTVAGGQRGGDINGAAASARFGSSVALSDNGNVLAASSSPSSSSGSVRVYSWSGSAWSQQGSTLSEATRSNYVDYPDVCLSADGTVLASYTLAGTTGRVRAYSWDGSSWSQRGSDLPVTSTHRLSGSVSISDSGALVAYGVADTTDGTINASSTGVSRVRVFNWTGSAWSQQGSDLLTDSTSNGGLSLGYGNAIYLSGDGSAIAVGSINDEINTNNSQPKGSVYVYGWSGSAWVKRGSKLIGDAFNDRFGSRVVMNSDGTVVAASSIYSSAGYVKVFAWNGSAWTQRGATIVGEASGDLSGYSLSLSNDGSVLGVGSQANDGGGTDAGSVRVYSWNGSAWSQSGSDIDGTTSGDYFGTSVSLNASGSSIAVGAPASLTTNTGYVRVFQR